MARRAAGVPARRHDGLFLERVQCLQTAALRPPALRAIATCYASDDRYADDVHYRGGLVTRWTWCTGRPACRPGRRGHRILEVVGEKWRETWYNGSSSPHGSRTGWLTSAATSTGGTALCVTTSRIDCGVTCVAGLY